MPEGEAPRGSRSGWTSLGLVQREIVLVGVLSVVAVILFGATENLADWVDRTTTEKSAAWFARGHAAVEAGDTAAGIESLRRAVAGDRLNPAYTVALARALIDQSAATTDEESQRVRDEALQLLVTLRERQPDAPDVNYYLARLAAGRGDRDAAVRFYNHAIYGIASEDPELDRRRIRVELATYLLGRGDRPAALAELMALAREVPNDVDARLELAGLFLAAGDARQALTQYSAAMAIDQTSQAAAIGAGRASFELFEFRQAQQHFEFAVELGAVDENVTRLLEVTRLVRSSDPVAAGIATTERVLRLRRGLDWAATRLAACAAPGGGTDQPDDPLVAELEAFAGQPAATLREANTLTDGLDLIARAVGAIASRCRGQAADPLDDAWRAIERARQGGP
jgi:tetratricopeptide (TPR) repeat protein